MRRRDPQADPLTHIPTVGEYAAKALNSLIRLITAAGLGHAETPGLAVDLANEWLDASLHLMNKFPSGSRQRLAGLLPFTALEMAVLSRADFASDSLLSREIASRVLLWATQSPILVEEASVDVADFLRELRTHLDLWSERQQVDRELMRRLSAH